MRKLFILFFLALYPCVAFADNPLRTITVTGRAEKNFDPDIAHYTVTIIGTAPKREEAKKEYDKRLNLLLQLTQDYKIDNADISTGFSALNPNYEWQQNSQRILTGYSQQSAITLTIRDLKKVGPFTDDLVKKGFDTVVGPEYALDKLSHFSDNLLVQATANAKQKAAAIAESLDEKLDKPVDIREENSDTFISRRPPMRANVAASVAASSVVAAPQGVINVQSSAIVTFSLK